MNTARGDRRLARPVWAAWAMAIAFVLGNTAGAEEWKFDVVHLKTGKQVQGLIVKESPAEIELRRVSRKPGSATVVNLEFIPRKEIDRLEPLSPEEREQLAARLEKLAEERKIETYLDKVLGTARPEDASPLDGVEFQRVPWGKDGQKQALCYESAYFRLVSSAQPKVAEFAAYHLEQIYGAYSRYLPARVPAGQPTRILLPQSVADYQAILRAQGRNIAHPALFDPERNEVIIASDLQRISDGLAAVRQQHDQLRKRLQEQEEELQKVYKGKVPKTLSDPIAEARASILQTEKKNKQEAEKAIRRLLRTLYHEAFHAYLNTFVYPATEAEVPRWLNEGLAQVFEGALVEASELRVERPDPDRLQRAQALVRKRELVPLPELLKAAPRQFLVAHGSDQETSDRYYLTSWALAYYLTFDRRLVGTSELDDYVRALRRGTEPLSAFQELVRARLPEFEKGFQDYLLKLRHDGRARAE